MGFFTRADLRARSATRTARIARIKADLFAGLGLTQDDAVSVNETACAEAGCPDVETVVLVMRAGEPTRAFRIRRPLEAVAPADVTTLREEEARLRAGA